MQWQVATTVSSPYRTSDSFTVPSSSQSTPAGPWTPPGTLSGSAFLDQMTRSPAGSRRQISAFSSSGAPSISDIVAPTAKNILSGDQAGGKLNGPTVWPVWTSTRV